MNHSVFLYRLFKTQITSQVKSIFTKRPIKNFPHKILALAKARLYLDSTIFWSPLSIWSGYGPRQTHRFLSLFLSIKYFLITRFQKAIAIYQKILLNLTRTQSSPCKSAPIIRFSDFLVSAFNLVGLRTSTDPSVRCL